MYLIYKAFITGQQSYFYNLVPSIINEELLSTINSFNMISCRSEYSKNSFIPNVINEWNQLDPDMHSFSLYNLFCNTLLKFIRPAQKITFNINDSVGIKLLTRFKLAFCHLCQHKFRHGFSGIKSSLPLWYLN